MTLLRLRTKRAVALAITTGLVGIASCSPDRSPPPRANLAADAGTGSSQQARQGLSVVPESSTAQHRVEELRARFVMREDHDHKRAVLDAGVATHFELRDGGAVAVLPREATQRESKRAHVLLPLKSHDRVHLEDDTSHVAVDFALHGASEASSITVANGIALYRGAAAAIGGTDIVHRVHAQGTEDFVVFDQKPAREEISYDVDVSRVAGLRFVRDSNTIELLDATGAPRLRIAPPYVVDARGERTTATLRLEGCAYDTNATGPWGRPVTAPNASHCSVHVAWNAKTYPVIVDPTWSATGSLVLGRNGAPTATLLGTGKVLVAGGISGPSGQKPGELYDPVTGTFGATGSLATGRYGHTATLLTSGRVLFAGGSDPLVGVLQSAEVYDPVGSGTFAPTTSTMTSPRFFHTATLLPSGAVMLAGGDDGVAGIVAKCELYDPGNNSFVITNAMAQKRTMHRATLLNTGRVLVMGGDAGGATGVLSSAELFNPAGVGTWSGAAPMAAKRLNPTSTLLVSNKVLVAGGSALSTAEVYDAGLNTWAATANNLALGRDSHSATLLVSGKVLIAGGSSGVPISTAELFDPAANTFSTTGIGSFATARHSFANARLASGRVLIAAGSGATGNALSTAEVFGLTLAGAACTTGDDCVSGSCEENICCATTCGGTCKTCSAGTGACVTVTSADDLSSCTGVSTCDAAGACKLKTAQPCPGGAATCATGACSDGVCCTTACAGACDSCTSALGASGDGTCTTLTAGSTGNPACGSGLACNGVSASCPTTCASDADCLVGNYCAADGSCQARKAQAATCNIAAGQDCLVAGCRACTTGSCVDGVCCDTACNGTCQACVAALKQDGLATGTCGAAKDGTNPHNDPCPVDLPATCARDGKCAGSGGCRLFYPPGTSCGASTCDAVTNKARGQICNGGGVCANDPVGVSCTDYLCAAGSCPNACTTDDQCSATAYCKQGSCIPKGANGTPCAATNECSSTMCVDGFCCNKACDGQCEACDATSTEGSCTPIVGAPHKARTACPAGTASNPCGQALCDGITAASCTGYVGTGTSCRTQSCAAGTSTLPASCDGKGGCAAVVTKKCEPFVCDPATNACATTCKTDGDCVSGNKCDVASSKCVSGATCSEHTVTDPAGNVIDCAPYNCEATGLCKSTCGSVADCATPNVCDGDHKCVAPVAATSEESGCSMAAARTSSSRATNASMWLLLVVIGGALARRRRRA